MFGYWCNRENDDLWSKEDVHCKHAGFHSTEQLEFLICTLNICSSTSLICLAPGCTAEQIMWGSGRGVGWRTLSHVQSWVATCGMVSALHYGKALHAAEQRLCTGGRGGCCRLRCLETTQTSAQLYRTSVREKEKGEEEEGTAPLPSRGGESNCDRNLEQ
jgi:hypothetical protein